MSAASAEALSPTELRLAMLANAWSPLPVSGKRPTLDDWSRYCRSPATEHEIAYWGRAHGGAASTGLALGRQAGIDIDVLSDPALAEAVRGIAIETFGETPFIRVGRAPKVALVYRAAPDVVSASYKAASGNGDGLDILCAGRQIVAFGRHVETGLPYAWVGAASPFDARPEAAPVITADQIAEFIVRVEAVMPLGGSGAAGGRRKGGGGGGSTVVRNAAGLVSDGREGFLFGCVWRAAHGLREAKEDITAEALADAAWALFSDPERGAVLDDGGWKKADAAYRAKLTVRRLEAGTVELGAAPEDAFAEAGGEPVAPTYADNSVSKEEARAELQRAVDEHFAAGVGHRAIKVGTGLGKTRAGVLGVSNDIKARRAVGDTSAALYLTPRHDLNEEIAELFRAEGLAARVFRGRDQPDPDLAGSGKAMCLDLEVMELAKALNKPIGQTCCKGENQKTGTPALCPLYNLCGYQRQFGDTPAVWVGAHAALYKSHAGLGDISSVTIDESFVGSGLKIGTRPVTLDDLGTAPMWQNGFQKEAAGDLAAWRWQLASAMRRQIELGGLRREHLVAEGLDVATCTLAHKAEWKLRELANLWPGMSKAQRAAVKAAAEGAGGVPTYTGVWAAARDLLEVEDEDAVSGRLILVDVKTADGFGSARAVLTHGIETVKKQWRELPVLALDASLPPVEVLRAFFPDMEVVADIEAKAPHATVRQVLGAPISKGKLHGDGKRDAEGGIKATRNLQAVRRAVLLRWARAGRPSTLLVAQKETAEWLRGSGMPDPIAIGHYGALSGLDGFKDVALLIAVGRSMLDPPAVETMAGALTGLAPVQVPRPASGVFFHDKVPMALRMADKTGRAVEGYRHPDPVAEAMRWQRAEGGLIQAIGRARAVNRTAENPVTIEIWSDMVLPVTVDEAVRWDDVPAGLEADMVADGVALESPSDMAACWPGVWGTGEAAKQWAKRSTRCQTPIESFFYRVLTPCDGAQPAPAALKYQRPGSRQKWRRGWHLPEVVPDPRAWLESRLGAQLAGFETLPAGEAADHHPDTEDAE